ncbi:MAG: PAS domain S-box protein [Bacteroidia bacterium]|nr:PAS domain S-box protein [Bacteroidia bacterium]
MPRHDEHSLKFQSVFQNAIDGIVVIDEFGLIEEINTAALTLFGYEKDELVGKNVSVLMPEPHQSNHDGYIEHYKSSGVAKIIGIGREVEGLKKDGTTFPFRLAVSEVTLENRSLFTGIIHDLSEQRRAQEELKGYADNLEGLVEERTRLLKEANAKLESEVVRQDETQRALLESQKLYKAIAENFPNGTISVLDPNLNFLFIEGQGLRDMGYGTEELVGRNYLDVIPEETQNTIKQRLSVVFEGTSATFVMEVKQHTFRVRAVPLEDDHNAIDRILLVESNITQQKNAEREIYNSLQKEKELNEMKSKFVSMASHEFRTPLSTILSSSSLIGKYTQAGQPDRVVKHTERIQSNVRNLTMILNDFLSIEKLENYSLSTEMDNVDIVECINDVKEDLQMLKKPNQTISLHHNLSDPIVKTDRFIIQNILTNLVSNAIKYSPDNETILIKMKKESSRLTIVVKDNGIGISKEDQEHLFNRFYRASNAGNVQGTGLGLHIVKRYIALLNGELIFESRLNEGSTFGLTLELT